MDLIHKVVDVLRNHNIKLCSEKNILTRCLNYIDVKDAA